MLKHAITFLKKENWETDIVVLLQPTTPFRTGKLIDKAIRMLIKKKSRRGYGNQKARLPTILDDELKNGNKLKSLIKNGNKFLSRQQTPTVYQPAGSVYALRKKFYFQ